MSQPKQGNFFMLPNEIFNMDLTAGEIWKCFADEQKYGDEIRQAVRREGTHRNGAYHCGAPRRGFTKRKSDV